MNVGELRIGSIYNYLGKTNILDEGILFALFSEGITYDDKLKPILLTEEWLLKFDFIFVKNVDDEKLWCLDSNPEFTFFESNLFIDGFKINKIKLEYIHQLQSLYFALTGEEFYITEL